MYLKPHFVLFFSKVATRSLTCVVGMLNPDIKGLIKRFQLQLISWISKRVFHILFAWMETVGLQPHCSSGHWMSVVINCFITKRIRRICNYRERTSDFLLLMHWNKKKSWRGLCCCGFTDNLLFLPWPCLWLLFFSSLAHYERSLRVLLKSVLNIFSYFANSKQMLLNLWRY